jgi:hypothetical protein
MGWKNVKEHYQIKHQVAVYDGEGICIGSPLCHDLIIIDRWRKTVKHTMTLRGNEDLERYWDEMHADMGLLKDLVASPDIFEKSVMVYTYEGGDILEKFCEEPGWPNVTHDGDMMYENMFSTDRDYIVERARKNAEAKVELGRESLAQLETQLAEKRAWLEKAAADLEKLNAL